MQWGDTDAQNGYPCCVLQGQVALTCRFQAQLCYACFNAVELKTCKLGHLPQQPRREPYFLSRHMLYLTSQSIKLRGCLCVGVLIMNKDHCKNNGAESAWFFVCMSPYNKSRSLQKNGAESAGGWRDMQFYVPIPMAPGKHPYRI